MRGWAPQGKLSAFFFNFVYFKSIKGVYFCIPFLSFFSPNLLFGQILDPTPRGAGRGGDKQKNIHPCLSIYSTIKDFLLFFPYSY